MKRTYVTFEQAKWLKHKGFDEETRCFYTKGGSLENLIPRGDYVHLYEYGTLIASYFDGEYNWNGLDLEDSRVCLQTAFGEIDDSYSCECSAPEYWQVVEWLLKEHDLWVYCQKKGGWWIPVIENFCDEDEQGTLIEDLSKMPRLCFNSNTEAYSAAFDYILNNYLK